ncbi:TPA: hypothetical protein ACIUHK_004442, partial [Salmonella enterica subsp. enterica serovar Chailey]
MADSQIRGIQEGKSVWDVNCSDVYILWASVFIASVLFSLSRALMILRISGIFSTVSTAACIAEYDIACIADEILFMIIFFISSALYSVSLLISMILP